MTNLFYRLRNIFYRVTRGKTVGVRVLLVNDGKILLVKHSYRPLWYMPGGAVDYSETGIDAAKREVEEEVGVKCGDLELFGFYHSIQYEHDDYVALYVAKISSISYTIDPHEISQASWFEINNLPSDISPGTKRRIDEFLGKTRKSDKW